MKNNVGKGAFVLVLSGLICKVFGGLFRLPLTNIVGIEGIGIYQMITSIYSLALVFVSGGVTNALSKLVSSARARGDVRKIGSYVKYALIFSLSISAFFAVFFFLFAPSIGGIQGIGQGSQSYRLFSLILPLGAMIGVARGLLQGYENMVPTAVSQILEQVSKLAFGLIFAYILGKNGSGQGVFGAFLGITCSEFLACVYLLFSAGKKARFKGGVEGRQELFSAVLPLTFGNAILPLTHAIEGLFIISLLTRAGLARNVATSLYGLQTGVVGAIMNFPLIISMAVAVALLPNLSRLSASGDKEGQRRLISTSFSCMWFLLVPLVVGVMAISGGLYPLVYPKAIEGYFQITMQLTTLGGISIIMTAIMQLMVAVLQANGFYSYSFVFYLLGGIAKTSFLFIFAPIKGISIFAVSISNILLSLIVSICILIKLGKLIKIGVVEFLLPVTASAIMFFAVKIFLGLVGGALGILLSVFVGVVLYGVFTLPLLGRYYLQLKEKFFGKKVLSGGAESDSL